MRYLLLSCLLLGGVFAVAKDRPNVVMLLSDDLGSRIQEESIDLLAENTGL